MTLEAEVVLRSRAALAEGPLWHPHDQVLYWTDLLRGELHRFEPGPGRDEVVHGGRTLGCFGFRAGGGFVLGTDEGLFRLLAGSAAEPVQPFLREDPERRLNDGKVDPEGRFWCGSNRWDFAAGGGALHRLGRDGLTTALGGLALPNGIDWSPDGRTMYHADSIRGSVEAYDFDPASGSLGPGRAVIAMPNDDSSPLGTTVFDGLAVDSAGNLWIAIYGCGEVRCVTPVGSVLEVVRVPALATSSVAFGGADLGTLYITTGSSEGDAQPDAGSIFACRPGATGQPASFWADE